MVIQDKRDDNEEANCYVFRPRDSVFSLTVMKTREPEQLSDLGVHNGGLWTKASETPPPTQEMQNPGSLRNPAELGLLWQDPET